MAPGYIAVGLAIREMRAAKLGDHGYQLGHWIQRHFSLVQWCVATRLSFLKDTHRTCGVVMGIGFLVGKIFCVMIEIWRSELDWTGIYKELIEGTRMS